MFTLPCQAIVEPDGKGWAAYCLQTGGIAVADTFRDAIKLIVEQTGMFFDEELTEGRDPFDAPVDDAQAARWFELQGIASGDAAAPQAIMFALRFRVVEDHREVADSAIFSPSTTLRHLTA